MKWSTPLSQLLPGDFALNKDYETTHITLEDALSHRSGLARHDLAYGWDNASTLDIIRTMRHLPLSAEPRTKWQYCNLMYGTVGAAIEKLTGKDLETVMGEFFWRPLGMLSTMFSLERALRIKDALGRGRLARGYYWQGEYYVPEPHMDITPLAGAGATFSSVNDYSLWVQALLAKGRVNESSPIDDSLRKDMFEPRTIWNAPGTTGTEAPRYSLGWLLSSIHGSPLIAHGGSTVGFGSQVFLLPNEKFGFVTMANRDANGALVRAALFLQLLKRRFANLDEEAAEKTLRVLQMRNHHTPQTRRTPTPKLPLPGGWDDYTGLYSHPGYGVFNVSRRSPWGNDDVKRVLPTTTPPLLPLLLDSIVQQHPILPMKTHDSEVLYVEPSSRMWPGSWSLRHDFLTFFHADLYFRHGVDGVSGGGGVSDCANVVVGSTTTSSRSSMECRNETVYEYVSGSRAVFEYGEDGRVRWLGMQTDGEVVEYAMEEERGGDGMIWFERV